MQTGLAWTALLMGLAGGPHCLGMCSAACGGIVRLDRSTAWRGMAKFQAGRFLGYSLAGGLAAGAVQNIAWVAAQTGALRPLWTLFHLAILGWGLSMLILVRQPMWVEGVGYRFWSVLRPKLARQSLTFAAGAAWALMPCSLLYSALLVASLCGGPWEGALSIALFAAGSGITLALGPWLWVRVQVWRHPARQGWSMRAAGASLVAVAAWALVHDLDPRFADYCRSALAWWVI